MGLVMRIRVFKHFRTVKLKISLRIALSKLRATLTAYKSMMAFIYEKLTMSFEIRLCGRAG